MLSRLHGSPLEKRFEGRQEHRSNSWKFDFAKGEMGMADEKAMEALRIFRTMEDLEKIKYLSRLRALAGKPAPVPAPPRKAP